MNCKQGEIYSANISLINARRVDNKHQNHYIHIGDIKLETEEVVEFSTNINTHFRTHLLILFIE